MKVLMIFIAVLLLLAGPTLTYVYDLGAIGVLVSIMFGFISGTLLGQAVS